MCSFSNAISNMCNYFADITAQFHPKNHLFYIKEQKSKNNHFFKWLQPLTAILNKILQKKWGFTLQPDHSRAVRRSGKIVPCLYGAGALQWHCQCCSCRVLVFPQWTEADVSRDTCSGSASSSTASRPGCRGSAPCPKIHPSLSPLACYCLKHSHGFMNSFRHFHTFLICCLTIKCCKLRDWLLLTYKQGGCHECQYWCKNITVIALMERPKLVISMKKKF